MQFSRARALSDELLDDGIVYGSHFIAITNPPDELSRRTGYCVTVPVLRTLRPNRYDLLRTLVFVSQINSCSAPKLADYPSKWANFHSPFMTEGPAQSYYIRCSFRFEHMHCNRPLAGSREIKRSTVNGTI